MESEQRTKGAGANELHIRTKRFAIEVCRFVKVVKLDFVDQILARQLVRSATSVAANHRAARRARSRADMIGKLKIVEEEADEACFWLEMFIELNICPDQGLEKLHRECDKLIAMTIASIRTLRSAKP